MRINGDILLVEDNLDDRFLLQHWLKKNGVPGRVVPFGSAEEAQVYLQEGLPDEQRGDWPVLILLSVTLAGGAGMELLEWIRSRGEFNRVLILALGNSPLEQDIQRAFDLGANGYFAKGIDFDNLAGVLNSLDFVEANYGEKECNDQTIRS